MTSSTPKSSSTGDIHELRYRISQLEHLIATSSLNSNNSFETSSLPSNSSALRTPHGLIQRVNELEGLLAASEGENRVLVQNLEQLTAEKNRGEVALLEKLFQKDIELKDVKEDLRLTNVKLQKASTKLENVKDYINGLPCQEELDEAKSIINKLEDDNRLLETKVRRMKEQISKVQVDLLEKEKILSDAEVRYVVIIYYDTVNYDFIKR